MQTQLNRVAFLLGVLVLTIAGCKDSSSNTGSADQMQQSLPEPWHDGDAVANVSTLLGEQFELTATKSDFYSVLKSICNHYEISCDVKPKWLLDRGITLKLSGSTIEVVLQQLSEQSGLAHEKLGEKHWLLVLPGKESSESETVQMDDY